MIEHYAGVGCFSGAVLHQIDIGLDQKLSMPEDSYVLGYFDYMNKWVLPRPPVALLHILGTSVAKLYATIQSSEQKGGQIGGCVRVW